MILIKIQIKELASVPWICNELCKVQIKQDCQQAEKQDGGENGQNSHDFHARLEANAEAAGVDTAAGPRFDEHRCLLVKVVVGDRCRAGDYLWRRILCVLI